VTEEPTIAALRLNGLVAWPSGTIREGWLRAGAIDFIAAAAEVSQRLL
jgi:hypothetical protein